MERNETMSFLRSVLLAVAVIGLLLLGIGFLVGSTPTVYFDSGIEEPTGCWTSETEGLVVDIEDPRCQKVLKDGRYEIEWEAPKWMRDEAAGIYSGEEE